VRGANFIVYDQTGITGTGATLTGIEVDVSANNANSVVAGVSVGGSSTATPSPNLSTGFRVSNLGTNVPFQYGFVTLDGAALLALSAGCESSGNRVNSQAIQLTSRDSGGTPHYGKIIQDSIGDFLFLPDSAVNTNVFTINKNGFPQPPSSTFANLPYPFAVGQIAVVTDSTVNTWGSTIAGSGVHTVLAWSNGSNWTVVGS
jgi:hypothetical protein